MTENKHIFLYLHIVQKTSGSDQTPERKDTKLSWSERMPETFKLDVFGGHMYLYFTKLIS